jgi:hypothetical protein
MANRRNENERKRIPVGGNRDILTVEGKDINYVYRWVNDVDGRVQKFIAAFYDNVYMKDGVEVGAQDVKQGSNVGSVVSKDVGKGITAYLMRIRKEYYEEDQAAKQRDKVDRSEEIIFENVDRLSGKYGKIDIN